MARYRFGVFEADEASGELTRSGRRVHLAPQPFRALLVLVGRAGAVVTHDELRRALWGEDTFVEFGQGIRFTIGRVRAALGDDPRASRFVETVPARGYRFVAPVSRVAEAASPTGPEPVAPAAATPAAPPRPPRPAVSRAALLAALLLLGLLQARSRPWAVPYRGSPLAHEAFVRGQELAGAGRRRESLVEFRRAARLDPTYAEAHFAVASVYVDLAEAGELAPFEAFPIARAEAQRALQLEDVADTHMVLASERFMFAWDWEAARREYQRATALAPDSAGAFTGYARLLSAAGEHDAALGAIDRAEALSPSCDLILMESGWVRYRARRYAEAVRKFERAAELGPPHFMNAVSWQKENRFRILLVHQLMNDGRAAARDVDEIVRLSGSPLEVRATLQALPPEEAVRRVLRTSLVYLARAAEHRYIPPVRFAEVHAALGQDDEAVSWLARAAAERAPTFAYSVRDPVFDRLRARPEFVALLARLAG